MKIEKANWRPDEFTPPGVVRVSAAALELAQATGLASAAESSEADWVMTFYWYLSQRVRYPGSDQWEEQGGGLDVGPLERSKIPAERIETTDGLEFAIQIPMDVCLKADEGLIDVDGDEPSKLVLR